MAIQRSVHGRIRAAILLGQALRLIRLLAAVCTAAALLAACGGQSAPKRPRKHSSGTLARSVPARLAASHTTSTGSSTAPDDTSGGAPTGGTSTIATKPRGLQRRPRGLQRRLERALAQAGPQVGLVVTAMGTGQTLFSLHPNVARPPASVEKLYTTVAALNLLGPNLRLRTTVLGQGRLEHGIWHGNLYLRGGGDPTFGDGSWNEAYEDGNGPTALQLAQQLRHEGIHRVTGHLFADDSLFDRDLGGPATHDLPDTPDYGGEMSALVYDHGMSSGRMSPAIFAAHELALTLRGEGVQIGAASRTRDTPTVTTRLAAVRSPPISELVRLMDVPSDDLIADMLAKQIGSKLLGRGTLAAGATEIRQSIATAYKLHPTVYDGSGLDRHDRTTPAQVATLLHRLWNTPTGDLLHAALPVVGKQGTVQSLGIGTPAQNHCVAKTGTLNNVTNLAGYCHARGGINVAFALMIDGPPNAAAFPMLSRVVAAIARY